MNPSNNPAAPVTHRSSQSTLRRLSLLGVPLCVVALVGCIEPNRSASADTVVDVPECDPSVEGACAHLDAPPCATGLCVDGRCTTQQFEGYCEAPDACQSESRGICLAGGCYQANDGCAAVPVDGCHKATCGPAGSCAPAPVAGLPCINERAVLSNLCNAQRLDPVDLCSDDGTCTAREAGLEVLPDAAAIVRSNWWLVTHRPPEGFGGMRAGIFTFAGDGSWGVKPYRTSLFGLFGTALKGTWCLDATGGLALALGEGSEVATNQDALYLGALARGSDIIAGAGATNTDVLIGTRVGGLVIDVDGAYSVFLTRNRGANKMGVYVGSMTFKKGVLDDNDTLVGDNGDPLAFLRTATHFRATNPDGLANLDTEYETEDGAIATRTYVGAIAPRGATVVLASDEPSLNRLGYGIVVMVRFDNDTGAPVDTPAPAWWSAALQLEPTGGLGGLSFTSTAAIFMTRGQEIMGGVFGNDGEPWESTEREGRIVGGTFQINNSGALGASIEFGSSTRRFGGFTSAARDFGVFFDAGTRTWDVPEQIPDEPQSRTFGFLVRRNEAPLTPATAE